MKSNNKNPSPEIHFADRPEGLTAHRAPMPALTGLRFFAAAYVVLFHSHLSSALKESGWPAAGQFLANGSFAVLLFFLLSGLILSYTYEGQIGTASRNRRFWEARFSRIWPLYVVSLLLGSLVYHGTPALPVAAATLLMVQSWNPFDLYMAGAWNYVCWTLSVEALFYLIFPFVQRWLQERSTRVQSGVLLGALALTVAGHTGVHGFGYPVSGVFRFLPLAIVRIPDFLTGVCMGNLYLRRLEKRSPGFPIVRSFGLATWTGLCLSIYLLCHEEGWRTACSGVAFALFLAGITLEDTSLKRILSLKPVQVGGQISFAMYLLQWPCKMGVNQLATHLGIPSQSIRFIADLTILLLLSAICYYSIEVPARHVLRSAFARLEAKKQTSAKTAGALR